MNFLAHLYLSGDNPQVMVGNFIGDFVKGRDLRMKFGVGISRGIELHRAIDLFTDHHPVVRQSKSRLWTKYRHYSGVITDIFFDHFLADGWSTYSQEPLADYAARTYKLLIEEEEILPERVNQLLPYMVNGNWLVNYAQVEGIRRALSGMARRATFVSKMEQATEDLTLYYEDFQKEFDQFFPELKRYSEEWLRLNP
jgi:acyl carrier protein phosphodiesterase